jgi:hypothetical protein
MVCLKKNLIGAIIPGLVMGGPTLCWILACMNFLSIPGKKRLTMKDTTRVPITAISEYIRSMVYFSSYLNDLNCPVRACETGITLNYAKLGIGYMMTNG